MLKLLLKIILGFGGTLGGFYLAYLYVKGLEHGSNPLLLISAILLVSVGVYFLIKASSSSVVGVAKAKPEVQQTTSNQGFSEMLKRNNELESKWARTAQLRDQLKVLQVSAEEADEKAAE